MQLLNKVGVSQKEKAEACNLPLLLMVELSKVSRLSLLKQTLPGCQY